VGCAPETSGGPYWNEKTLEPEPFICPQYSYPEKSMRKFGRGVANIVTAPLEIVNQPLNYLYRTESGGVIPGITAVVIGVPAGVGWMVYRLLSGALDVATFPLPFWRPVIKPEFVVNDFQKRQVLQIKSDEEMKQRLAPYRCPADRP
jgi:putative exosortase-associated protein (TIGR04073 family)